MIAFFNKHPVVFAIISALVFLFFVIMAKKRMTRIEMYSTSLFAIILTYTVDQILGEQYHLYGYFHEQAEYKDFIVILGIYPAINILFLNYFPFHKKITFKILYFILWSAFALFYEWLSVKLGLFFYHGWKLWYSAPIYPILYLLLIANLMFTRKINKTNNKENLSIGKP
ncbi:hypothetical protein EV207_13428 [Scopulibacillus darangshiensis]|uniref:Uncharacterized protein n=1 Tax=Scopulibacillus darangshiensis TaxID=442528 RepID=A0A4V2SLA8_9BACL|nr:CBO0543 family protein [Scopulibacillus darangshiensis]TCP22686.1 hypothetical protein EV207_13428 [Scopulibacillus darangshiensis]